MLTVAKAQAISGLFAITALLVGSSFAKAHEIAKTSATPALLALSDTFKISWPRELNAHALPMLAQNGFLIHGKHVDADFTIWTSRVAAPTIANQRSIERLWTENLETVKVDGEAFENQGCRSIATHAFRCKRALTSRNGSHVAEALYWNAKSDLVVVRVMSSVSIKDASEILEKLAFEIKGQLPTVRKGANEKN